MKVILIAAGRGSRLQHHTNERPKCMVEVQGRSILDCQLEAFRQNLDRDSALDLHIIRGYLSHLLTVDGATYYENTSWQNNNILHSLFCAKDALHGECVTTYSDIVYTPDVVARLLDSPHDISLVVDRQWHTAYEGRTDHPVEQAELVEVDERTGHVSRVGKSVGADHAVGEFIGLAKYSAAGARVMTRAWEKARATHADEDPFFAAAQFRKAYLTDLFAQIIESGHTVGVTFIDGGWREIDTVQDLERISTLGLENL